MEKIDYDKIIKTLFPKITFSKEDESKEKQSIKEHFLTKGIYLHKHVYDAIMSYTGQVNVSYIEVSDYIRYDKSIRDKLYKYLSAAEEYLRSELSNLCDIKKMPKNPLDYSFNATLLKCKDNANKSNLYYALFSKKVSLGKLVKIIKENNVYRGDKNDLDLIVELRNKVMHHTLLLTSYHTDKNHIDDEIANIEAGIMALYRILPTAGLKEDGLTKDINKSNYKDGDITVEPYAKEMRLRRFANGIFEQI